MRHQLMNPAFPDIVGAWAADEADAGGRPCANDNRDEPDLAEINDPLLLVLARIELAATRLW